MLKLFNLPKTIACCFGIIILLSAMCFSASAQTFSSEGKWLTLDEKLNTPRSVIKIWQDNNEIKGKILKIYYRDGEKSTDTCTKCKDALHKNKPFIGMTILWGLKKINYNEWANGFILDPESGEIYHCKLTLSPNTQQLIVKGYIGVPLFGRSQTWMRVDD